MATRAEKHDLGVIPCPVCKERIPLRQSAETGTLHYPCQWCQSPSYMPKTGKGYRIIMGLIEPGTEPQKTTGTSKNKAQPATKAVAAPTPAPAPRRASSIFDLGSAI